MKWIAFFSQTGSEIVNLSNALGRKPDLIVTNNFEEKIPYHEGVRKLDVTIQSGRHDILMTYFRNQSIFDPADVIITLHGYLRVLPADICEKYKIFNGHPGAIDLYPELKGKDPQEKVLQDIKKYPIIGSVVHECTAELDAGKILTVARTDTPGTSEEVYKCLKDTSLLAWQTFMKGLPL